ncbi:pyridoxal-phosphate dependent enzyme [Belnapia sp. T6]|uniref:Pyridoxal-phosphate dependent enzyme n=1 Tax=Belnapia mucosa TaxID=2804532 RepID=A0ABS1V4F1_9PROT|nr:pyridoxal-phosphate dependent enzyme [Belnapia mucosa]MBL6456551.1 pyridoxal-phosphate dependent enzyme [Belnapia mucosa]
MTASVAAAVNTGMVQAPAPSPLRNPRLIGFRSLAGGVVLPVGDYPEGCPEARAAGRPTSLAAVYADLPRALPPAGSRMAGAADWLPYCRWAGLGEGGTPLIALPPPHGVGAYAVKAEWLNPTGSHKDRMSPLVVARAVETGAAGIACASSGNAGISLAAYAARAGLPCRVIVTRAVPEAVRRALLAHGAEVSGTADSPARWRLLARLAREGWYPATNYALPAAGSSPWGVEGFRSLALELAAEAPEGGWDALLVPTARGDLISGLRLGFEGLREAGLWPHAGPRLVVVEPFPRLSAVLTGRARISDDFPGRTAQASTAGNTATDQALRAVRESGGTAIAVPDEAATAAQAALARQGIFLELCAAAAHAAMASLREAGLLRPGERVAMIGTAAGTRDPAPPPVPPLEIIEA